jgi:hypothetical protein
MSPDLTTTNTFLGIMAAVSVLQVMAVIAARSMFDRMLETQSRPCWNRPGLMRRSGSPLVTSCDPRPKRHGKSRRI